jgi:hypothetical protein
MAIDSNFSAKTVTFLVDGVALGTIPFDDPTYDTQGRASLEVITNGADGGFSPLNYTAQFDNVSVTAVPEPSNLALCGACVLGLLGVIGKRRKPTARSLR